MSNKTNIEKDIKILQKLKDVNKYNSIGKAIENSIKAFILKCQITILQELLDTQK